MPKHEDSVPLQHMLDHAKEAVDIKSMFCPTLFWDADTIDASDHANYIIARILDFGDMNDIRTLRKIYLD